MSRNILQNVVGWLGGTRDPSPEAHSVEQIIPSSGAGDSEQCETEQLQDGSSVKVSEPDSIAEKPIESETESQTKDNKLDIDLHDVSEKAMSAAKEIGSYLFSFGKSATEQVTKTAMHLKETVEEKTIIGDFSREQNKFVAEQQEKKKLSEAAVPPWVGYNEEEVMKTQIMALSKDKRNLLRNPPAGVPFNFDYDVTFPTALVMLEEDPRLKEIRFELVPKQISEENFWRNFFYRVSLIKQSTQLTSLAQMTGSGYESSKAPSKNGSKEKLSSEPGNSTNISEKEMEDMMPGESTTVDHEFVSDTFDAGVINDEDLVKELNQLGVSESTEKNAENISDWEKQLQDELLNELGEEETDDLEKEILKQIESESKET